MEVHRDRGFGFTSRPYSFMDLRGWAQERQYGLDYGVPIYRKNDGLWLPLTEVRMHPPPAMPCLLSQTFCLAGSFFV